MNEEMKLTVTPEWKLGTESLLAKCEEVTEVNSEETLAQAGALDTQCKKHLKTLASARLDVTRRIDAVKKQIMAAEKELAKPLTEQQERLNSLCSAYATALLRKRREEEERIREEERKEAERMAAEAAKEDDPFGEEDEDPFGEEVQKVEPVRVPATKTAHTDTNSFVTEYVFRVVDPTAVPRQFCVPDQSLIRAYVQSLKKQGVPAKDILINGITVTEKVSVRGK